MPENRMVDDYNSFKNDLLRKTRGLPSEIVASVVSEYSHIIDSKRRSSCIKDLYELILVLEKRCYVSPEDYSELHVIVNCLPEEDKRIMLARLNHRRTVTYDVQRSVCAGSQNTPLYVPEQGSNVPKEILPEGVLNCVSAEIGKKWRDLARGLGLREGDLNKIDSKNHDDFQKCAYESLLLFQSRCTYDLRRKLLQALEKARRKDLQDTVENIYQMNR